MSWPSWMPPSRKPESDTWCEKHQCQKTWMITSGFCPKCEQEQHGDKGSVAKLQNEDELIDLEITVPDFKIIKDCIDCYLGKPHVFKNNCPGTIYGYLQECTCANTTHKWLDSVGFFRCTKCLGYNQQFNQRQP